MYIQKFKSEGLAHLSYVIGDDNQIAVIDPKRDIDDYLQFAAAQGAAITHIFETHRNEDYVIGSVPLAAATGAAIHHGSQLPFKYGQSVKDKQVFEFTDFKLQVLSTPGHTDESISIAVCDKEFGDAVVAVFTGDALFVGDVGRTDFFPDRAEEVAGNLYDSIFNKLLPLGDHVLIYPGHGAGSVCGSGMAAREFSTLGCERKFNARLQLSRDEFIRVKTAEQHYKPPYFKMMEKYNLEGPPLDIPKMLQPFCVDELEKLLHLKVQIVDIRPPEAFAGAFIPGTLAIPSDMLAVYAGWLLDYDHDIVLVGDEDSSLASAVTSLHRIGYDRAGAYIHGGIQSWEVAGRRFDSIAGIFAGDLIEEIESGKKLTILDVRSKEEFDAGHLSGSQHIYLGHLPGRIKDVSVKHPVVTFCGSGRRALIAASVLKKHGFKDVRNCFGSLEAILSINAAMIS